MVNFSCQVPPRCKMLESVQVVPVTCSTTAWVMVCHLRGKKNKRRIKFQGSNSGPEHRRSSYYNSASVKTCNSLVAYTQHYTCYGPTVNCQPICKPFDPFTSQFIIYIDYKPASPNKRVNYPAIPVSKWASLCVNYNYSAHSQYSIQELAS